MIVRPTLALLAPGLLAIAAFVALGAADAGFKPTEWCLGALMDRVTQRGAWGQSPDMSAQGTCRLRRGARTASTHRAGSH